jgi:hypothetical protein
MRTLGVVMLTLIVTGCGTGVSDRAVCSVTARPSTEHARALAEDGGPKSVTTGRRLIAGLDAACAR